MKPEDIQDLKRARGILWHLGFKQEEAQIKKVIDTLQRSIP